MVAGEVFFQILNGFHNVRNCEYLWGRELLQGFPNVIVSNTVGFSAMRFLSL